MPPWIFGCSVLTRPSIISGKPVTSLTLTTLRPASARAFAVPPVDTSSKPRSANDFPNGIRPVLSETLRIARRINLCPYRDERKTKTQRWWIEFSELTPNVTAQYHPRSPVLRTRRPQVAAFFCCPYLIRLIKRRCGQG